MEAGSHEGGLVWWVRRRVKLLQMGAITSHEFIDNVLIQMIYHNHLRPDWPECLACLPPDLLAKFQTHLVKEIGKTATMEDAALFLHNPRATGNEDAQRSEVRKRFEALHQSVLRVLAGAGKTP